jgi:hypothetical protein
MEDGKTALSIILNTASDSFFSILMIWRKAAADVSGTAGWILAVLIASFSLTPHWKSACAKPRGNNSFLPGFTDGIDINPADYLILRQPAP